MERHPAGGVLPHAIRIVKLGEQRMAWVDVSVDAPAMRAGAVVALGIGRRYFMTGHFNREGFVIAEFPEFLVAPVHFTTVFIRPLVSSQRVEL